ncbi:MAG: DPP IV N-terminal domain-containing protein [Candidatus Acidiferrales bacterium]
MRLRPRGLVALAFLLCVLAAPASAQKELTVERIYGLPSLSGTQLRGVQWSPDGKLVSYERSIREEARPNGSGARADAIGARGRSEIWVMDVASGERRVLLSAEQIKAAVAGVEQADALRETQTTGAGRAARTRYIWVPSGEALLYVSGADLYWFDVKTGAGKALVRGKTRPGDPKISPDGRWVSFVRDYDLWLVDVASGKERRLTSGGREEIRNGALDWVYPEELGIRTAYWWSPDSKQLAYMQMDQRPVTKYPLINFLSVTGENEVMRYPKAGDANPIVRIGVVGVRGGKTRWMDTGKETDMYIPRVDWLPDSKRVAIQRMNRAQNKLEFLFAEAKSGRAEVVLTEEDRYWINVGDDLYFFSDGQRFLWGSERDGFRHLYLYEVGQGRAERGQAQGPAPTGGKLVRQVTKGEWAVTSLEGVDEKGGAIYFTATEKSPLERHLYRVGLDGGDVVRVSRADGSHGIVMSPDARHYIDTYSNVMTPPRQNLHRADGAEVRALQENRNAALAEYALQKPEFLQVRAGDGTALHAMMIKPRGFDASQKYPVLIFTYGGPHSQIVRNAWGGSRFLWHQMMAQKGYIIFYLDNRGMAGRGHAFESHVHKRMGEIELADQLVGVNYLKSLPYVDGSRIGIWGWSYGGYMTLYAMLNAPAVFKAGFAGAPVTAWENYDTIYSERYMSTPQLNPEGYKKSAPLSHAAKLAGKLLMAHGTADDNVHYANTVQMQEEFIKAGKYAEVMVYPERGHGVSDRRAQIHLFKRVTEFFLEHL